MSRLLLLLQDDIGKGVEIALQPDDGLVAMLNLLLLLHYFALQLIDYFRVHEAALRFTADVGGSHAFIFFGDHLLAFDGGEEL